MSGPKPRNCWEYWDCPEAQKVQCPAYILKAGDQCAYLTIDFHPRQERGFKTCEGCSWNKKTCLNKISNYYAG